MHSDRKHLAALVLCEDNLVRAYATVAEARAAHPRILAQHVEVKETGAKAAPQDDCYTLLREPEAAPTLPRLISVLSSLRGNLLRTNVQKAVRRQDAAAAAVGAAPQTRKPTLPDPKPYTSTRPDALLAAAWQASVAQYFAQAQDKGQNAYQKKLLERLPIIAAEDATTVPLLPLAVFHRLGATSFVDGPKAARQAAPALALCAAQLAAAQRDPACTDRHTWGAGHEETAPEDVFNRGWSAEDAAQACHVHTRHACMQAAMQSSMEAAGSNVPTRAGTAPRPCGKARPRAAEQELVTRGGLAHEPRARRAAQAGCWRARVCRPDRHLHPHRLRLHRLHRRGLPRSRSRLSRSHLSPRSHSRLSRSHLSPRSRRIR